MSRVLCALDTGRLFTFFGHCHAALSRRLYACSVMLALGNAERLLYQLYLLAHDFAQPVSGGVAIDLPLRPRRDLGPLVALGPPALTRALNELEAAGRVRTEASGRIVVRGLEPRATATRRPR